MRAEIAVGAEPVTFEFNFRQAHNLVNALAAIGAAHALGVPLDALAEGRGEVSFSELRGEEIELPSGALLINDCYNANPISMRAALDHLAARRRERGARARGRRARRDGASSGPRPPSSIARSARCAAGSGRRTCCRRRRAARATTSQGYGGAGEARRPPTPSEAAELVPRARSSPATSCS